MIGYKDSLEKSQTVLIIVHVKQYCRSKNEQYKTENDYQII